MFCPRDIDNRYRSKWSGTGCSREFVRGGPREPLILWRKGGTETSKPHVICGLYHGKAEKIHAA